MNSPQLELFQNKEVIALQELLAASRAENRELRQLLVKSMNESRKLAADLQRADQRLFSAHGARARAERAARI